MTKAFTTFDLSEMTVLVKCHGEVALISHLAEKRMTRMVAIIFQAGMPLKAQGVEI